MKPRNLHRQQQQVVESPQVISQRVYYFMFSVLSAGVFLYIWLQVPPAEVQNSIVTNSYLPLLLAIWGSCAGAIALFFTVTRGLIYGFVMTLFIFLRLHQIQGPTLLPALLLPVLVADLILTYRKRA